MKLFSFKKKKPTNLPAREAKTKAGRDARESKKQLRQKEEIAARSQATDRVEENTEHKAPAIPAPKQFGSASQVIIRPRVTEKATDASHAHNTYVFDVLPHSTKQQIASGVRELYGVVPERVTIVQVPAKRTRGRRGEGGIKTGGKKAYVYLKKGDSIEIV